MKHLISILLLISSSVFAADLRFEAAVGLCQYGKSEEGSWWNGHYETNIDRNDKCFQAGLSQVPWKWGRYDLGWRVHYVDLGRVTTNSVMAARDEDQFSNPSGKYCNPETMKGCLIRTVGGGHAKGVSLGGVIERKWGRFTGGFEAGAFVYHNYFSVNISAHPEGSYELDANWDLARGWLATPYIGLTGRHEWLFVSARAYHGVKAHGDCGGCSGITQGAAYSLTAGVAKDF